LGFPQTDSKASGAAEERGGGAQAVGEVEKGAFDFAAALGEILCDDKQICIWISGQVFFAPESAGGQLGLSVGGFIKADAVGGRACTGLLRFSPGVEEPALRG
jgi:hypothetical protein